MIDLQGSSAAAGLAGTPDLPHRMRALDLLISADRKLAKVETVVATVIFVAMLSFMVVQVSARYFFEVPLPWSEELIRYLFVMTSFIGAAAVCKYREHIEINLIDTFLASIRSEQRRTLLRRWQQRTADALSLVTLAVFTWYSHGFVKKLFESDQRSPAMEFPTYIVAGVMLVGLWLMIVHYVVKLLASGIEDTRADQEVSQ